jgi:hypothetical protein
VAARQGPVPPLPAVTGNMWVPVWAIRPGAYEAVDHLASEMPLWLALHSRNADYWRPCYASREALGATIGVSSRTVTRHLRALRDAWLVFEVERGMDRKSRQHRPPARWALDPFTAEMWREKVEGVLAAVAEEDGQDGRWVHNAVQSLDAFERRSRLLALRIAEDMPIQPKRKRSKKPKKKRAASQNVPRRQNGPRGDVSTTGEVVVESLEDTPPVCMETDTKRSRRTSGDASNIAAPPLAPEAPDRTQETTRHNASDAATGQNGARDRRAA